jgi:hypothetical protein
MDPELIALSKTYPFIDLWYNWTIRYADELSKSGIGYGFRGGVFYPRGAKVGRTMTTGHPSSTHGCPRVPYTGIHALFCYQHYASFKTYWDSGGAIFNPP